MSAKIGQLRPTHNDFRCRRKKPFLLFHWSPVSRRAQIQREGLKIGKEHVTHSKGDGWQAQYLCFSNSPSHAWALSGEFAGKPIKYDLWIVWSTALQSRLVRGDHRQDLNKEYRTLHDVPPHLLWRVGTRAWEPPPKRKRGLPKAKAD